MQITLARNLDDNREQVPYLLNVEMVTITMDAGHVFHVPVAVNYKGLAKRFKISICGFVMYAERPHQFINMAEQLITSLINVARLPSYVFIARHDGSVYPVYTIEDEVFATSPGGPVFRHIELAKVREYLSDYLHAVGILGSNGRDDKLHARGIDMHTLGLRRPVFYLKKRIPDEIDFWAPVFLSGDGKRIYTYAASARREVPIGGGQEVLLLRELVARALIADRRLTDFHNLRPDRLMPEYWQRLVASLTPAGSITINGYDLPLYHNNYIWIGLETRPEEERYSLFVGNNADDVSRRAQLDFNRRDHRQPSKQAVNSHKQTVLQGKEGG